MTPVKRLLTACLCLLACLALGQGLSAQHDQAPADRQLAPAGHQEGAGGHEHASKPTLEMENSEFFTLSFGHSVPEVWFRPELSADPAVNAKLQIYNVNVFQWIAIGVMLVLFLPVVGSFRGNSSGWFVKVLRGWCRWIRDEMVYSVMGKEEGQHWTPFFLFLFFFIAVMNVVGLIPSLHFGGFSLPIFTATATPWVTGALALVTLLLMLGFGIKHNGLFGFFKGLLPHGLPLPLIPLMIVVELTGLVVKPFALTIRLFANMLAGHLVVASAVGLIFLFAKMQGGAITSYLTAVPCAGMAVFIYIIESFVVLLQAYIFTFLSILFIQQAMHQEH